MGKNVLDHPCHVCFKLAYWFQRRRFLNIFPIGSYVKTMSTDGGHLGYRTVLTDTILKGSFQQSLVEIGSIVSEKIFFLIPILTDYAN
jgi:hypothetical protein